MLGHHFMLIPIQFSYEIFIEQDICDNFVRVVNTRKKKKKDQFSLQRSSNLYSPLGFF